jgi:hypothetical protein
LVRRVTPAATDAPVAKAPPSRYELHELLRQFAADKLAEEPTAAEATHSRHAHYYLRLLTGEEAALQRADQQHLVQHFSDSHASCAGAPGRDDRFAPRRVASGAGKWEPV